MVVKKIMETWELSDDDKQVIKNKAQRIKYLLTLKKADTCADFYNWCKYYDYDFLGYMEEYLPFIKDEWKYISEGNIDILIHEIDSAIRNIKTNLTVDDFDNERDIIEFIIDKYSMKNLLKIILEYGDKELINKLINGEEE